jgi:hypothetical protein
MFRPRHRPSKPAPPIHREVATWLNSLPVPEAREGGDSTWALWHEASRKLDEAFAETQPSAAAPLSADLGTDESPASPRQGALTADALMVVARRNNRVCPRPEHWLQLYHQLEGSGYVDLEPPPVGPWLWNKLSDLQKRLRFREHVEWAERHGKLEPVARFMAGLAEADWLHMGDN